MGITKLISSVPLFANLLAAFWIDALAIKYPIYIWQGSPVWPVLFCPTNKRNDIIKTELAIAQYFHSAWRHLDRHRSSASRCCEFLKSRALVIILGNGSEAEGGILCVTLQVRSRNCLNIHNYLIYFQNRRPAKKCIWWFQYRFELMNYRSQWLICQCPFDSSIFGHNATLVPIIPSLAVEARKNSRMKSCLKTYFSILNWIFLFQTKTNRFIVWLIAESVLFVQRAANYGYLSYSYNKAEEATILIRVPLIIFRTLLGTFH